MNREGSPEQSTEDGKSVAPKPQEFTIEKALGRALRYHTSGQLVEAKKLYQKIIDVAPNQPVALHYSGVIAHQEGHNNEAVALISRSLAINPNDLDAHCNLGLALEGLEKLEEAVASFRKAIEIKPDYALAHNNIGNVLMKLKRFEEASGEYKDAITIDPDNLESQNKLAQAFVDSGHLDKAGSHLQEMIRLDPENAEAHGNLGFVVNKMGNTSAALTSLRKAIFLKPEYAEAHNNLGLALQETGRFGEALAGFKKAITIEPTRSEFHLNLGLLQLLMGDFENGWKNFTLCWRETASKPDRAYAQPFWQGEDITAKTLLIYPEHGLGDFIHMSRYVPMVKALCARLILEVPPPLFDLFSTYSGADVLIKLRGDPGHFDLHVPLVDLSRIFETRLETIPSVAEGLSVPCELIKKWKAHLAKYIGLRVGLVWSGNPTIAYDRSRSLKPELLKPLLELEGVNFFSLQVDHGGDVRELLGPDVVDLMPEAKPFPETAAAMENLDLIISIDTSAVHLAATLGRPVWVLLPLTPYWCWMIERDDSPWYPTVRLFRQQQFGDWGCAIDRIAEALKTLIKTDIYR